MLSLRLLPLLIGLAGPVCAETACLTAEALAKGVRVTVKDGSVQTYRAQGRDVLAHVPNRGLTAEFVLARGLHVIRDHRTEHDTSPPAPEGQVIVGGNDGGTITTDYAFGALPRVGKDWSGSVRMTRNQDGPSIGPQPVIKGKLAATIDFLPEETVTISGCPYRIQPVETALTVTKASRFTIGGEPYEGMAEAVGMVLLTRRQIWFPDLGFAVITRERGAEAGWSDDWGQGITGLAAE